MKVRATILPLYALTFNGAEPIRMIENGGAGRGVTGADAGKSGMVKNTEAQTRGNHKVRIGRLFLYYRFPGRHGFLNMISAAIVPFDPLFRNPHLQTIAGHYWRRPDARCPKESRFYRTEPDVQDLVQSQRPEGKIAGEILMVHGLEGSGQAGYIRSLSATSLRAGFAVHRFHMRTCGGTEQ